jgi:hypothetical protein
VRGFAALRLCVKVKGEQAKAKAQAEEEEVNILFHYFNNL